MAALVSCNLMRKSISKRTLDIYDGKIKIQKTHTLQTKIALETFFVLSFLISLLP